MWCTPFCNSRIKNQFLYLTKQIHIDVLNILAFLTPISIEPNLQWQQCSTRHYHSLLFVFI